MFLKGFLHAYIMVRLTKGSINQASWEHDSDYRLALIRKRENDCLQKLLKPMNKKQRIAYFRMKRELDNAFELTMLKD